MTKPQLMAILNLAPDSFYAPSSYPEVDLAIARGLELQAQGADWIDVGAESTRPGATPVAEAEERARVVPVVQGLVKSGVCAISVDTSKPAVAEACLKAGASMINDITGFTNPRMRELAISSQAALCVMHMQGTPQTMQRQPSYPDGVVDTLLRWFEQQVNALISAGANQNRIFLDPGIGFGKTVAHNVEILQNLPRLITMGYPLLLGVSRKSFMSRILNKPPAELLPATLAVNTLAIRHGVGIIRVHDVAEHRAIIDLLAALDTGIGGLR
jgi:dihydropteroate synthase